MRYDPGLSLRPPIRPLKETALAPARPFQRSLPLTPIKRVHRRRVLLLCVTATQRPLTSLPVSSRSITAFRWAAILSR